MVACSERRSNVARFDTCRSDTTHPNDTAQRLAPVRPCNAASTPARTRSRSEVVGDSARAAYNTARPIELALGGAGTSSSGREGVGLGTGGWRRTGGGVWRGPWNERRAEALAMKPRESPMEVGPGSFRGRDAGTSAARRA